MLNVVKVPKENHLDGKGSSIVCVLGSWYYSRCNQEEGLQMVNTNLAQLSALKNNLSMAKRKRTNLIDFTIENNKKNNNNT